MNIPEVLQATLKTNLADLNDQLIKADPRLDTVTTTLNNIAKVAPTISGLPQEEDMEVVLLGVAALWWQGSPSAG